MRLLLMIALLLLGCGAKSDGSDSGHLGEALNGFNTMMRWQRYHDAATFLPDDKQAEWLQGRLSNSVGLHITDVNIAGVKRDPPEAKEAIVFVRLSYYREPNMTLRDSLWKQTWKLMPGQGWRMTEEAEAKAEEKVKVAPAPSWP